MKRIFGDSSKIFTICISTFLMTSLCYADHDIRVAAHELSEASNHVYSQASRESRGGRDEYSVLSRLRDLATAAEHFHRMVETHYSNPRHIDHDFRDLEYAFYDAKDAMRYARFSDHVWRDFNQCEYAMRELRYTFGYDDGHDDHRGQSTINRPGRLALEIK